MLLLPLGGDNRSAHIYFDTTHAIKAMIKTIYIIGYHYGARNRRFAELLVDTCCHLDKERHNKLLNRYSNCYVESVSSR